jgi:glutamyl-tRNA synthetase
MPLPFPDPLRVRFAPSPTGYLHVGGARTALFNWLLARRYGGAFLLRIEDTDRARSTDESTRAIFTGLNWLGLDWDEDVTHQGANIERHRADAERLLAAGAAYRCFCTADELTERRRDAESRGEAFRYDRRCDRLTSDDVASRVASGVPHVLRVRVPDGDTAWDDLVHGTISFPNKDVDDFVVLRSDGTPIYNLAVVSDDIAMGVTLVMRGDDHISNTPKQILIYRALGAALPVFAHLPMIHGSDGRKLSKRHGATAVGDYAALGIMPEAMINFLALLGWSPGDDREVLSRDELIALFSEKGLLAAASVFDPAKLEWMNGQHLMRAPIDRVVELVSPALVAAGLATGDWLDANENWLRTLVEQLRTRARTIVDLVEQARPFFGSDVELEPDAVAKQWKDRDTTRDVLRAAGERLATLDSWESDILEQTLRALAEARGVGAGKIMQPLRVALTGRAASPGMFDVLMLLGRDRSLHRINRALDYLVAHA